MRFLIKVRIPTAAENPLVEEPQFGAALERLFRELGASAAYSRTEEGRRVDYALIDITDMTAIIPAAKRIFDFLKVKPEFLPEIAEGRFGY